jgi:hypothetical protein
MVIYHQVWQLVTLQVSCLCTRDKNNYRQIWPHEDHLACVFARGAVRAIGTCQLPDGRTILCVGCVTAGGTAIQPLQYASSSA